MESYILKLWLTPLREKRQQREWLPLTCVECVAFIDIWVSLDAWSSGGDDLNEDQAAVTVICRAGRNKQHYETQKQPQRPQRGTEDGHGLDLFGNCGAWNWLRPTCLTCLYAPGLQLLGELILAIPPLTPP